MASFAKRQQAFEGQSYTFDTWWYSPAGTIVRYVISGVILAFFVFFILGGYMHAKMRMKKGHEPLAYHRWMISNDLRRRYGLEPRYVQRRYGGNPGPQLQSAPRNLYPPGENVEHFNMNNWNYAPPPPAYNVPHQPPPEYFPEPAKGKAEVVVAEEEQHGGASGAQGSLPEGMLPQPERVYGGAVYR